MGRRKSHSRCSSASRTHGARAKGRIRGGWQSRSAFPRRLQELIARSHRVFARSVTTREFEPLSQTRIATGLAYSAPSFSAPRVAATSVGRMTSDPPRRNQSQGGRRATELYPSGPAVRGQALPPGIGRSWGRQSAVPTLHAVSEPSADQSTKKPTRDEHAWVF